MWTESAVVDLESIKDYISRDSEYFGMVVAERKFNAVERISEFPGIERMTPEADDPEIKEILVHNYRVIYRIYTDNILILAIVHSARDMQKLKPWEL